MLHYPSMSTPILRSLTKMRKAKYTRPLPETSCKKRSAACMPQNVRWCVRRCHCQSIDPSTSCQLTSPRHPATVPQRYDDALCLFGRCQLFLDLDGEWIGEKVHMGQLLLRFDKACWVIIDVRPMMVTHLSSSLNVIWRKKSCSFIFFFEWDTKKDWQVFLKDMYIYKVPLPL